MPVVFVSHATKDDPATRALEAWLCGHGFTDIFVDHGSIAGGEKWAQALRDASGACRVIICLVTERWLGSDECFGEFKAAWYMGRLNSCLAVAGAVPDQTSLPRGSSHNPLHQCKTRRLHQCQNEPDQFPARKPAAIGRFTMAWCPPAW
jgi:hypothetical protein